MTLGVLLTEDECRYRRNFAQIDEIVLPDLPFYSQSSFDRIDREGSRERKTCKLQYALNESVDDDLATFPSAALPETDMPQPPASRVDKMGVPLGPCSASPPIGGIYQALKAPNFGALLSINVSHGYFTPRLAFALRIRYGYFLSNVDPLPGGRPEIAIWCLDTGGCGSLSDGLIAGGVVDRLAPSTDREKLGSLPADLPLSLVRRGVTTAHPLERGIDAVMDLVTSRWYNPLPFNTFVLFLLLLFTAIATATLAATISGITILTVAIHTITVSVATTLAAAVAAIITIPAFRSSIISYGIHSRKRLVIAKLIVAIRRRLVLLNGTFILLSHPFEWSVRPCIHGGKDALAERGTVGTRGLDFCPVDITVPQREF
ncbi:uncharacterized protein CLUP02_06673 [Colletotrichum lupini]|uniref:Uncharacterized protein n=1 Tax=Colletotrichum lupini TaxID=145971 RepID=A0A9Q8WFS2_9PEZI|nr:uncharacterized protein CLUP02_06673 [Colletotrichum lupini]UQC81187.1 hypothetical protein CLUP02_06673 [Colletotrichum lupini]